MASYRALGLAPPPKRLKLLGSAKDHKFVSGRRTALDAFLQGVLAVGGSLVLVLLDDES